jgi:hypothetical protein
MKAFERSVPGGSGGIPPRKARLPSLTANESNRRKTLIRAKASSVVWGKKAQTKFYRF